MPKAQLRPRNITLLLVLAGVALAGALTYLRTPSSFAKPLLAAGAGDWPMYGHDQSRTNFNPAETAINRNTVANLQQLWQANIGSNGVAPSGAPSVANGQVYVASSIASGPNFFA